MYCSTKITKIKDLPWASNHQPQACSKFLFLCCEALRKRLHFSTKTLTVSLTPQRNGQSLLYETGGSKCSKRGTKTSLKKIWKECNHLRIWLKTYSQTFKRLSSSHFKSVPATKWSCKLCSRSRRSAFAQQAPKRGTAFLLICHPPRGLLRSTRPSTFAEFVVRFEQPKCAFDSFIHGSQFQIKNVTHQHFGVSNHSSSNTASHFSKSPQGFVAPLGIAFFSVASRESTHHAVKCREERHITIYSYQRNPWIFNWIWSNKKAWKVITESDLCCHPDRDSEKKNSFALILILL